MSHDPTFEKAQLEAELEHAKSLGDNTSNGGTYLDNEFTEAEKKKIVRRVDWRLVTTVGSVYCISLLDRTNMSAAAIAGMREGLDMVGNRYSVATLVFFVTYIVFQPPSTVIVRALGPRIHISAVTLAWGATMIGMGFCPTFDSIVGLRLVMGIFEAGFFPSCVYLLSTWYTRYEVSELVPESRPFPIVNRVSSFSPRLF